MITKRIAGRKDGGTSARAALRYGEGLKCDRKTGNLLSKSHRTRLANFGLVDDGIYIDKGAENMAETIELAAAEMQATCDRNTRVGDGNKIAHFLFSFDQTRPSEAVLRDTEDSMISALRLSDNHWASFLHSDNGHWHLHLLVSRIDRVKHRGNDLWQDKTIRDRVGREIEKRHGLARDNGLHRIDANGQIVEVPREEREKKRGLKSIITDRARTTEIHSGERTFQSWAEEFRIGDRLKHAKSWQDLHTGAAAYGCEISQRGAGFVIHPTGEKGGIQLSRIGLRNLPAKFGLFEPSKSGPQQAVSKERYKPAPGHAKAGNYYSKWQAARQTYLPIKAAQIQELRNAHKSIRIELKETRRLELKQTRSVTTGSEKLAAVSVAKMRHAVQMTELADRFKRERKALYSALAENGPGNTFREFLVREAGKGDELALGLARRYGYEEATRVLCKQEAKKLKIRAAVAGEEYRSTQRLQFTHRIEPSGTVVYHLGGNRLITDSALSRRIELNDAASHDAEAIATALRFASLKFGPVLTLFGPEDYQRLAVETAVRERLGIKFADPVLEAYREQLETEQQSGYRRTRSVGTRNRGVESKPAETPMQLPIAREEGHAEAPMSVRSWAEEWSRANHKEIVEPRPGGAVAFTVIHVAQDGIVLDLGRSIGVYPPSGAEGVAVGSKVTVGKNLEVLLQKIQRGGEKER